MRGRLVMTKILPFFIDDDAANDSAAVFQLELLGAVLVADDFARLDDRAASSAGPRR